MLTNEFSTPLKFNRVMVYFIIGFVLVYFIFSPAINHLYYAGDDFRYAFGGLHKTCQSDDGFEFMWTLGRPFQAYLDCACYKFAYTLERMSILRILSLGLLVLAIALFAEVLILLGFGALLAVLFAASVLLIPNLYFEAIITGAISLPISVVFVLLAYLIMQAIYSNKTKYIIAGSFILFSLLTYPAMSFFYGTLMLSKLFFSSIHQWHKTKLELFQETVLFVVVCFIYFVLAYCNMRFHALAPIPEQYRITHLNINIAEVLARVGYLINVFNPHWNIFQLSNSMWQGLSASIILITAILLTFLNSIKKIDFWMRIQLILAFLILFLISSTFFIVIPERDIGPRLLFGVITFGMVFLFWSIAQLTQFFSKKIQPYVLISALGMFLSITSYLTYKHLTIYVAVAVSHMDYIKTELSDYLKKNQKIKRIHFIIPKSNYPYNYFFHVNGVLTSLFDHDSYKVTWCSLARGVRGLEKDHQKEMLNCLDKMSTNGIGITYSYVDEFYQITPNMVVIKYEQQV